MASSKVSRRHRDTCLLLFAVMGSRRMNAAMSGLRTSDGCTLAGMRLD